MNDKQSRVIKPVIRIECLSNNHVNGIRNFLKLFPGNLLNIKIY